MNKTVLVAAMLALLMPLSVCAIGLGGMTVKSTLDQPFRAEIELIDVGSTSLSNLKASLANPENFEQTAMKSKELLPLLHLKIDKNSQDEPVITIQSMERMTEPYMALVVDVISPQSQFYKAYTVLLDPPGYPLKPFIVQGSQPHYKQTVSVVKNEISPFKTITQKPGDVQNEKKQATYGPTIPNETIWQIAQRFKSSTANLPQIVLAIVGANPSAFEAGNLNGLKTGVTLFIPALVEILLIPADLAEEEIKAHDKAWNDKTSIHHVLVAPYVQARPYKSNSSAEVPVIPKLYDHSLMLQHSSYSDKKQDEQLRAELSITSSAIESVRASNALLMEQLHFLRDENKRLHQQFVIRDKELELVRAQMDFMLKERIAIGVQANSSHVHEPYYWLLFLLFIFLTGGGAFVFWYAKAHSKLQKVTEVSIETLEKSQIEQDSHD